MNEDPRRIELTERKFHELALQKARRQKVERLAEAARRREGGGMTKRWWWFRCRVLGWHKTLHVAPFDRRHMCIRCPWRFDGAPI